MADSPSAQRFKSRYSHLGRGEVGDCDIAALRNRCFIPDDIVVENCSLEDMRATREEDSNIVNLFASYFDSGLTLPFHPFTRQVLSHCGVSPSQVSANFFRVIAGFIYLTSLAGFSWDHHDLFHHYQLKYSTTYENFFLQRKRTVPGILLGVPDSDKSWDRFPLRISGKWEFSAEEDPSSGTLSSVPRNRASGGTGSHYLRLILYRGNGR